MSAEKNNSKYLFQNMPEERIPNCWKDEKRLNVLFAPFRDKSVNHMEWDTKYSDWKLLIDLYMEHNRILTFSISDLEQAFTHNKCVPRCLNTVIDEMHKEGKIQLKEEFLRKNSETWTEWMTDILIKQPLRWSIGKVRKSLTNTAMNVYLHVTTVQDEAKALLLKLREEHKCKVMDLKQLQQVINDSQLSSDDLHIILHHLSHQKKASLKYYTKDNTESLLLIKFDASVIDDKEINIYILEKCEEKLYEEIHTLEAKTLSFVEEAKKHLLKGNKNMAKHALRRKHDNESRISQKYDALNNIQTLLTTLQDANTNLVVKDTYKKALDTLSEINKKLVVEEIDEIMSDVEESIIKQSEFDKALAEPIDKINVSSDSELEKELEALLEDDQKHDEDMKDIEKELAELKLPEEEPQLITAEPTNAVPST